MLIYVDIDDTICDYPDGCTNFTSPFERAKYHFANPIDINIDKINKLYDQGHEIVYYTARGNLSGIDWHNFTKSQLDQWGAKYHKLITGHKPAYDLIICDKSKRIEEI
jgi:hypothetical protein